MADGSTDARNPPAEITTDATPMLDVKQDANAVASARQQSESLVAEIQGHNVTASTKADQVEQIRQAAEKARADIDAQISAAQASLTSFNQQVESAKSTIAELATLSTTLQATGKQTTESAAQASASLETLRTLANTATESASRIEALKTQVEQSAQVAAQRSEHIEDGRKYVDTKRAEIDVLLNTAQQSASGAESQHHAARTSSENLTTLYVAAQKVKADTERNSESVASLLAKCKQHAATTKALADKADSTEKRIADYESRLAQLETTANERLRTIETLLPQAAGAGLAHAFNLRRTHFKWPQRVWQGVFVVSLLALLGIAGLEFSLFSKLDGALTWDRLGLSLLHRLPFALPLIWLAIHSGHKAALAQRVEEDYAFKETVSRSFEGYRREMAELEGKAAPNSALTRLCAGVLGVITNPPGRIYEKHPLNNTPLSALADSAGPIASAATRAAKAQAGL
ncbi:MAG: hypothetical protein KF787_13350 [Phycisphaeraceae bacterium]|nr:hypothetical protein [Phycisphaerae bacterium]MBX3393621.1 hypothetical protein [Phycisphaeraceae bacterium]